MIPKHGTQFPPVKPSEVTVLCIGDLCAWEAVARHRRGPVAAFFVAFNEMTAELLDDLQPDVIYSPLLTQNFDTTEVAARLQELGFRGQYCAVATHVPQPQIIKNEVRMAAPLVKYDLLLTDETPRRLH